MNFKTTLILIALLAVAGIALLFTRDKGASTDTSAEPAKVVEMKADDIGRITITPGDGKKIVLERDGLLWRLTSPVNAPAETYAVQDLADALAKLESKGSVSASTDGTGVDKPSFTVDVGDKSGKSVNLAFGEKTAAGNNLYVKKQGDDAVLVVPADVYDQLDKRVSDFRRKKLVDVASSEVRQVKVTTPEQTLALEKPAIDWQMVSPVQIPAEASAVSDLITAVGGMQAVEFVDDDPAAGKKYGFDAPTLAVELSTAAPATQPSTRPNPSSFAQVSTSQPSPTVVKFGRYDDIRKRNIYVSVDGSVAKVAASSIDSLKKTPLDLRDRRVLNIDPASVTRISLKVDKPATTQPTTRPAEAKEFVITRRRNDTRMGPDLPTTAPATRATTVPTLATTQLTSAPSTSPTTAPATAPAEPESKWVVTVDGKEWSAGDRGVDSLLDNLRPLRADKYVVLPPLGTNDRYTLTVETTSQNYAVEVNEPVAATGGQRAIGAYNGLLFEMGSGLLSDLKADFTKAATVTTPAPSLEP